MNLLDLPVELLDLILSQLSKYDLLKFSETSKYSYALVKSVKNHYDKYNPSVTEFWNFKRRLYTKRYIKLTCEKRERLVRNYCKKLDVPWRRDSALLSSFIEGYLQKSPMECAAIMKCVQFIHSRNAYGLLQEHIQPLLQSHYYKEIIYNKKKSSEAWHKSVRLTIRHLERHIEQFIFNLSVLYNTF